MLWSRYALIGSTFCLSALNHLIQLISTVPTLDDKYMFFLLKEEKLLVGWVHSQRWKRISCPVLIWPFQGGGPCRLVSLIEPQADSSGESEDHQLCGYSLL